MIADRVENIRQYAGLHRLFGKAMAFLEGKDLAALPSGRHEIDGARVYAMIDRSTGRGRDKAVLEAHRKFIDIQVCLSGCEVIGYRPVASCRGDGKGYNDEKDYELFADRPDTWLVLPPGHFAVFFPQDGHAPASGDGPMHKVVLKIALE